MAVSPIPEGFHNVTPYLVVQKVPKLLEFLKQVFKAREIMRKNLRNSKVSKPP